VNRYEIVRNIFFFYRDNLDFTKSTFTVQHESYYDWRQLAFAL